MYYIRTLDVVHAVHALHTVHAVHVVYILCEQFEGFEIGQIASNKRLWQFEHRMLVIPKTTSLVRYRTLSILTEQNTFEVRTLLVEIQVEEIQAAFSSLILLFWVQGSGRLSFFSLKLDVWVKEIRKPLREQSVDTCRI